MALKINNSAVRDLKYNDIEVKELQQNYTIAWERPYTLSLSFEHPEFIESYSVYRNNSYEPGIGSGELVDGDTVYYKDSISLTAEPKETRYDPWIVDTLNAPEIGDITSTSIKVTNNNNYICDLYYGTTSSCDTFFGSISVGEEVEVTGLNKNTIYYFKLHTDSAEEHRNYYERHVGIIPDDVPSLEPDTGATTFEISFNAFETEFSEMDFNGEATSNVSSASTCNAYQVNFTQTHCTFDVICNGESIQSGDYVDDGDYISVVNLVPATGYENPWIEVNGVITQPETQIQVNSNINITSGADRESYTVTFNDPLFGSWSEGYSKKAFYGDTIALSGRTVTCYDGETGSTMWTNTCNKDEDDQQWHYTDPEISYDGQLDPVEGDIDFTATNTRELQKYTITWRYRDTYNTWATQEEVYEYGDIPSRQLPSIVTSGNYRYLPSRWDDLSEVIENRTITCEYLPEFKAILEPILCTVNESDQKQEVWFAEGDNSVNWTAKQYYSFNGRNDRDSKSTTINQPGTYTVYPTYVAILGTNGTRCSADGVRPGNLLEIGSTFTWTADSGYYFDNQGSTTAATTVLDTPTTYSMTANYVYANVGYAFCGEYPYAGYYEIGSQLRWRAEMNHSFNGVTDRDEHYETVDISKTYSATPMYVKAKFTETYSFSDLESGEIYYHGEPITWTSKPNYSFNGSASGDTASDTIKYTQVTYEKNPGYVYCTISGTDCTANKSTGWLAVGTVITWTAASGYHFGEDRSQTTISETVELGKLNYSQTATVNLYRVTFSAIAVPAGQPTGSWERAYVDAPAGARWNINDTQFQIDAGHGEYINYTPGTEASGWRRTGYGAADGQGETSGVIIGDVDIYGITAYVQQFTVTWKWQSAYGTWTTATQVYDSGAKPSRASPSTVTSGSTRQVFTQWDSLAAVTANRTITAQYKTQYNVTISGSYCSANKSSGWHDNGTVITWTANDNYSFGGSAVKDTTTATITGADTYSKTPGYIKCSISSTRCTANKTSGSIYSTGTVITWTASSGYRFSTTSATTTATVALGTTSYSASADYKNITVSSTRSTANVSSGYVALDTVITWTASSNYRFSATGNTTTATVSTSTGSYSASADYMNTTITGSYCTPSPASGWLAIGTTITWTANSNYRMTSSSATTTATTSAGTFSYSKEPTYVYCTIGKTNCSCNKSTGWLATGTTITWTANTGYHFGTDQSKTTDSQNVALGTTSYSRTASANIYTLTVSVNNPGYVSSWAVKKNGSSFLSGTNQGKTGSITYGDTLTATGSGINEYHNDWVTDPIAAPDLTVVSSSRIDIKNNTGFRVEVYRDGTDIGALDPVSSIYDSGLSPNTTYTYIFFVANGVHRTQDYWTYSATPSPSSLTVDGNETITITGSESSKQTREDWQGSQGSSASAKTEPQAASWHTLWTGEAVAQQPWGQTSLVKSQTSSSAVQKWRVTYTTGVDASGMGMGFITVDSGSKEFSSNTTLSSYSDSNLNSELTASFYSKSVDIYLYGFSSSAAYMIPTGIVTKIEAYY